jgi:hypothetical protein
MSNKYIREAAENNNKHLPATFEAYSLLNHSDASRVPVAHVQKLRKEFTERESSGPSDFVGNPIKWD